MNGYRYDTREYALGTSVATIQPWGEYVHAHVLCSDGKVRKTIRMARTADSFYSVPAAVEVKGKAVAGYVTFETKKGYSTETENDPTVVKFVAYTYRKNGGLLPAGMWRNEGNNQNGLDGEVVVG